MGGSVHDVFDGAIGLASDRATPCEVDITFPAKGMEGEPEGCFMVIQLQVNHSRRDSTPSWVSDRRVDAAQYLAAAKPAIAEKR